MCMCVGVCACVCVCVLYFNRKCQNLPKSYTIQDIYLNKLPTKFGEDPHRTLSFSYVIKTVTTNRQTHRLPKIRYLYFAKIDNEFSLLEMEIKITHCQVCACYNTFSSCIVIVPCKVTFYPTLCRGYVIAGVCPSICLLVSYFVCL